ncbi:MAG: uL30 family ribosomal protein [Candidatus Pacearchaeota archaeon]
MKKIIILRIAGKIDLHPDIKRTFYELKLDKKFACRVLEDKPEIMGMIKKIQNHVAYGEAAEETLKQLLEKRAHKDKKDFKQTFHLHPPRGGFKKSTKLMWPRGILGKNEKINELVLKML